ncbi:hypothetical protein MXD63_37485, partial [Frankia sp. Cpl3]|nr:hypothetical protein [Frankia sp. Cpl3]
MIDMLSQALTQLKWSTYARVLVELTLVKLCQPGQQAAAESASAQMSDPDEITALTARLHLLEEKLGQVLRGQVQIGQAASVEEPRAREPRRSPAAGGNNGSRTPMNKVREAARSINDTLTQQIRGQWSQILAEVKKVKIQHQAWLINGQPVAASNEAFIVVFTSPIHCDKTMEPELKGIVERVVHTLTGKQLQLLSILEE